MFNRRSCGDVSVQAVQKQQKERGDMQTSVVGATRQLVHVVSFAGKSTGKPDLRSHARVRESRSAEKSVWWLAAQ